MHGTSSGKPTNVCLSASSYRRARRIMVRWVRVVCCLCLMFVVLGGSSFRSVSGVSATTGNSDAAVVPAHFTVARRIAVRYPGQYTLQSVASEARLSNVRMVIEINALGFLQGVGS